MKIITLRALIYFCISSSCHAFDCNTDASEITDAARIPSDHSGYEVIAAGRSYFYTAPMSTCVDKQIFLVKNDHVDAYFDTANLHMSCSSTQRQVKILLAGF